MKKKMKLKIDWFAKVQIFIITFGFLSACQPSSPIINNPATVNDNHVEGRPTEIVTVDNVTNEIAMPLSQPLYDVVVVGDTTRPNIPQPDVIFQIDERYPINCSDITGEIWTIKPPYQHAEELLADSETAYLQPQWSPDGQWVAYWQSEISDRPTEETDEISWQFREDSIWVMRPDGQERRQLTDIFIRSTATDLYDNCGLTGGILHLVGWSQDSQWVAFLASPEKSLRIEPQLYLVNVYSGESHFLPDVWDIGWMPDANILIGWNEKTIEIVDTTNDYSITSMPIPEQIGAENLVYDAYIVAETETLWVITRSRHNSDAPRKLWLVDMASNEWQLQNDIDLGIHFGLWYIANGVALFCESHTGVQADIVQIRVYPSWELSNKFDSYCGNLKYFFDDEGNGWVGNFESFTQRSIQLTNLQTSTTETLIDWANTNISDQPQVASFDWLQQNTIPSN